MYLKDLAELYQKFFKRKYEYIKMLDYQIKTIIFTTADYPLLDKENGFLVLANIFDSNLILFLSNFCLVTLKWTL